MNEIVRECKECKFHDSKKDKIIIIFPSIITTLSHVPLGEGEPAQTGDGADG